MNNLEERVDPSSTGIVDRSHSRERERERERE
jgi:hypothetical protein